MNQQPESHFDIEGALPRLEGAELLIFFPTTHLVEGDEREVEVQQLQDNNPEVEDEADEAQARSVHQQDEQQPLDAAPELPVVHQQESQQPLDAAAVLASELRAFQDQREIELFGRINPRRNGVHRAEENISVYDQDSEDDEDTEPGDTEQGGSPEPAADVDMVQNSESNDTNMTGLDSEPGATNMDNLGSDDLSKSRSTGLQEPKNQDHVVDGKAQKAVEHVETLDRRLDVSHELNLEKGVVQSPTQPPIEESFTKELTQLSVPFAGEPSDHLSLTVAPSPLPSSQLLPSTSTLTICESSLEPNLITVMLPVDDGGQPEARINIPAD